MAVLSTDGDVADARNRPLDRRQTILDISARLFYEHGYANVGMRLIASAAEIRPASVYHHFGSKEEILFDICLGVTKRFSAAQALLLESKSPSRQRLETFFHEHIVHAWSNRVEIDVTERDMRELTDEHHQIVLDYRSQYRVMLEDFVAASQVEGKRSRKASRLRVLAALSMVNGVNDWFTPSGPWSIETVASDIATMAVDLLRID